MRSFFFISLLLQSAVGQGSNSDDALLTALQGASFVESAQPDAPVASLSDADFIDALLGGEDSDTGRTSKPKCRSVTDSHALGDDDFLSALVDGCEEEEDASQPEALTPCERGEFLCVPYFRCGEEDIVSDQLGSFDIRIGRRQFEEDFEALTHSECTLFGDVCCAAPMPGPTTPPVTPAPYQPRCGQRNMDGIGARIVGFNESETQFGEIPWMAAVLRLEEVGGDERRFFVCGGSLISANVVMTAAHCVHALTGSESRLVVRLGDWDTQHESELMPHEDVNVLETVLHPEFDARRLRDDVALLILEREVQLKPHIDTLCLPQENVNYNGIECVATGWGKDAFIDGLYQTVLKSISLPHVPRRACQRALRRTKLGKYFRLDRSFTCAGGSAGEDTCTGDGGSPLACRDPLRPHTWVQIGIVSWGVECGLEGVPGVYADVRRHLDWINEWTERAAQQQLQRQQDLQLQQQQQGGLI